MRLTVVQADITTLAVDAIVNAANASLLGGGGVDGAIHRVAGPELLQACRSLHGCHTGEAKSTPGFDLPAAWIFHTVGPVWRDGHHEEDTLLSSCYRHCLDLAHVHHCRSLAFPAISTGIYGFPKARAAKLAVDAVRHWIEPDPVSLEEVLFCCFSASDVALYSDFGIAAA